MNKEFPIPKDGILGHHFLLQNNAVIDIANNILTIKNDIKRELNKICFTLEPRTETVVSVPIADPNMENKNILIHKQELIQDVYCANIINTVKNGNTVISILNISESPQNIFEDELNKILYEDNVEYKLHEIKMINDNNDRVNKIKNLIRSDHLNKEERDTILEICEHFSDVFHLENDYLTFTNAAEHVIRLPANQPPIYKRPYRLPQAQQK